MKNLYLHIGMGKTGTTAIQNFCAANIAAFNAQGFSYPQIGQRSCAHHLISPHIPPFLTKANWVFLEPNRWVPKLAAQSDNNFVMSSELIAWTAEELVGPFCEAIKEHFNLKIVIYLRRQDELVMAGYNQMVKAGLQRGKIDAILEKKLHSYDYQERISVWEKHVGAENLIVRAYEKSQFVKGDLIEDFLTGGLQICDTSQFVPLEKGDLNPRLSNESLEYKRLINNVIENVDQSANFNEFLFAYSAKLKSDGGDGYRDKDTLSQEQRQRILDRFEQGNRHIAQHFCGREDGKLFIDHEIVDRGVVEPSAIELKVISTYLKTEFPTLHSKLIKALRNLKNDDRVGKKQAHKILLRSLSLPPITFE